jgi:hypothetical protein
MIALRWVTAEGLEDLFVVGTGDDEGYSIARPRPAKGLNPRLDPAWLSAKAEPGESSGMGLFVGRGDVAISHPIVVFEQRPSLMIQMPNRMRSRGAGVWRHLNPKSSVLGAEST